MTYSSVAYFYWPGGILPRRGECLAIMTLSVGPRPTTRVWNRSLAFYPPSIKRYPMTQSLKDPCQFRAVSFISVPIQHRVPGGLVHYAGSYGPFPAPLVITDSSYRPACWARCCLPEVFSFLPAVRVVKSLWVEASTECPLYMCAYQSSNSLECCTAELLPPCVCVAAQECVYIEFLFKEVNSDVKWQINSMAFLFIFFIGPVGRGR